MRVLAGRSPGPTSSLRLSWTSPASASASSACSHPKRWLRQCLPTPRGLTIAPLAATLAAEAARLRRAGATVIVATAHAGGSCKSFASQDDLSSCDLSGEIFEVAKALPPGTVDAIVGGHRHSGIAKIVAGTAIVEAFSNGRSFGRIDLQVDRRSKQVTGKKVFAPQGVCSKANPATGQCADSARPGAVDETYEGKPVVRQRRDRKGRSRLRRLKRPSLKDVHLPRRLKGTSPTSTRRNHRSGISSPTGCAPRDLMPTWRYRTAAGSALACRLVP